MRKFDVFFLYCCSLNQLTYTIYSYLIVWFCYPPFRSGLLTLFCSLFPIVWCPFLLSLWTKILFFADVFLLGSVWKLGGGKEEGKVKEKLKRKLDFVFSSFSFPKNQTMERIFFKNFLFLYISFRSSKHSKSIDLSDSNSGLSIEYVINLFVSTLNVLRDLVSLSFMP